MLINLSGYNSIGFECIEIYFMETNFVDFVIINKSSKKFCYNKLIMSFCCIKRKLNLMLFVIQEVDTGKLLTRIIIYDVAI